MRAVQSGEGKIGRGFLGQSLWGGDYGITFVDTLPDLVARLAADDLDAYEARKLYRSNAGYASPADFNAMELQKTQKEVRDSAALEAVSGTAPGSRLGALVGRHL